MMSTTSPTSILAMIIKSIFLLCIAHASCSDLFALNTREAEVILKKYDSGTFLLRASFNKFATLSYNKQGQVAHVAVRRCRSSGPDGGIITQWFLLDSNQVETLEMHDLQHWYPFLKHQLTTGSVRLKLGPFGSSRLNNFQTMRKVLDDCPGGDHVPTNVNSMVMHDLNNHQVQNIMEKLSDMEKKRKDFLFRKSSRDPNSWVLTLWDPRKENQLLQVRWPADQAATAGATNPSEWARLLHDKQVEVIVQEESPNQLSAYPFKLGQQVAVEFVEQNKN